MIQVYPIYSTLKEETALSSETSVTIYETIGQCRHILDESKLEELKISQKRRH
jgi:hypothetical protein